MSEEELKRSMGSSIEPASVGGDSEFTPTPEPASPNEDGKLRNSLGVKDADEEILMIRRPSLFAFMPAYFVGLCVLGLHLFFGWAKAPDDASTIENVLYFFVDLSGWFGGAGFALVMLFFTWLNRLINHPASGRWMTTVLLLSSLTPFLIHSDWFIDRLNGDSEFSYPGFLDWNFTMYGIFWTAVIWLVTFWYQKSFLYAVTNQRIIHHQKFIYERDGLRILHEDIIAVHKSRSPIGALFGYATVYCNIGDQSHVATETVGGAVGIASPESESKTGIRKWLGRFFFLATYQRTVKVERYTPDISFYGIRHWEEAYDLINKMHRENSAVSKAEEQIEVQKQMVELLSKQQSDDSEEELPDMDDLLDF
ncbi:MAG: PH domain-containing protein [Candidatus Thermoplasmatota archaeon]|nr:PH domain-containing protein [Candidatus Thermoplasmatota archaeon]